MLRWTQVAAATARRALPGRVAGASVRRLGHWLEGVKARFGHATYVDFVDIPDGPPSPYRARLTLPKELREARADLEEREVVRGKMRVLYEIRCACGKRWFSPHLELAQVCPRCDRAVLLQQVPQPPDQSAGSSA